MEKRNFCILAVLLTLAVVCESGVIVPRRRSIEPSSENEIVSDRNPKDKDKKFGAWKPEEGADDFGLYDFDMGIIDPHGSPNYDYGKPGEAGDEVDKSKRGTISPEIIFPNNDDHDDDESGKDIHRDGGSDRKPEGADSHGPFGGEEDDDKPVVVDKDSKDDDEDKEDDDEDEVKKDDEKDEEDRKEDDEGKNEPEDDDEGKKEPEEDDGYKPLDDEDKKEPEGDENKSEDVPEGDEEKLDEEDKSKDEDDDESKDEHVPDSDEEKLDEDKPNKDEGEADSGSIFDNPLFNIEQVRKYFHHLERALGHVFRQTLDEALLLNGTYANTTEEEVEIGGKKFIVQKSVIKGADNGSSIYIEALTSKSRMNVTEENKE